MNELKEIVDEDDAELWANSQKAISEDDIDYFYGNFVGLEIVVESFCRLTDSSSRKEA